MKIIIRIIGTFLAIVKLSTASDLTLEYPYLSNNILQEVKNISIEELLDYGKISVVIKDEFDKAMDYYKMSLEIDEKLGNMEGAGTTLLNIGNIYENQGNYKQALEYYDKSLKIKEEIELII